MPPPEPVTTHSIEFDFVAKVDRRIPIEQTRPSLDAGKHCWVDMDITHSDAALNLLTDFGMNSRVLELIAAGTSVGRHDVYDDCLHVSIAVPNLSDGRVEFEPIELILGERFMFTLHRGDSELLASVRKNYPTFFRKFAQSLGFLLFEVWDSLIDSHRAVLAEIEVQVEQTQRSIFSEANDSIFGHVSELTEDLLNLRKNVLAVREALDQLATHKSAFVAETAQPYLANMVGTLDRLANDLTVEREILAETLALYLGVVSHRTNRLLHRLTLVSVIFMPLMFLCGIYGMNLKVPEFQWDYGYAYFWILTAIVVTTTIVLTRARRNW